MNCLCLYFSFYVKPGEFNKCKYEEFSNEEKKEHHCQAKRIVKLNIELRLGKQRQGKEISP